MDSVFLDNELRIEYEKIKEGIRLNGEKSMKNWRRYISNEMSELEKKEYKNKIDSISNRSLVDFEEGNTSKVLMEFIRKAYKFDKKNIDLLGEHFGEDQLFIMAVRRNSMSLIHVGLKRLNQRRENYDPREAVISLTILYNCLKKMNIDPRHFFKNKIVNVDKWLKDFIAQYLTRDEEINTYKAIGYQETDKPKFGLIWTG